jgi:hypothetical protein
LRQGYLAQVGLKFVNLLPQPPSCWDHRQAPPHPSLNSCPLFSKPSAPQYSLYNALQSFLVVQALVCVLRETTVSFTHSAVGALASGSHSAPSLFYPGLLYLFILPGTSSSLFCECVLVFTHSHTLTCLSILSLFCELIHLDASQCFSLDLKCFCLAVSLFRLT